MKIKNLIIGAVFALLGVSAALAGNGVITLMQKPGEFAAGEAVVSHVGEKENIIPLKAMSDKVASVESRSTILYEDFSSVPQGETETIDGIGQRRSTCLANRGVGRYIDNQYTPESGTWEGHEVYAGEDGSIILQCYNPNNFATISTPLGDYSGDITVSVRARGARIFWGSDNELGYVTGSGSDLTLFVCHGGYDAAADAVTDIGDFPIISSNQIYEKNGWQEITFTFRNETAAADGFLALSTAGAIEIDWIKVVDNNTYLAAPETKEAFDFTDDGFSIAWDPVRRAFNYYIDLWKTVFTAPSGLDLKWDMEDRNAPDWIDAQNMSFADMQGMDDSVCMEFSGNGEDCCISVGNVGAFLKSFSMNVMIEFDEEAELDWYNLPTIYYEVYGERGWQPYGMLYCDGWSVGSGVYYNVTLNDEDFENKYSAVRIYTSGLDENNKIFIDNLAVSTKRPFKLERVESTTGAIYDPDDDDFKFNYYVYTDGMSENQTEYKFAGLDPNEDYWYRVRSHYVHDFTSGPKMHAFGVAAPTLLSASNISSSSYSANWKDAAKAQCFIVTNYKGVEVEEDCAFTFMEDEFSGCEGEYEIEYMTPLGNEEECRLDDYTDMKGWSGKNNATGSDMLGVEPYTDGYLVTPKVMVDPSKGVMRVYIEAYGEPGDYLRVETLKGNSGGVAAFDDSGNLKGWLELPAVKGEQIRFSSYYACGLALERLAVMQEAKAGETVMLLDDIATVPAGLGTHTFSNLNGGIYYYDVESCYSLDDNTVCSVSDQMVKVDTENGNSSLSAAEAKPALEATELERYSLTGVKVDKNYQGVVMVKMSDGTIIKKIAR